MARPFGELVQQVFHNDTATPSASFDGATRSAAASTSGCAFATATPRPADNSIGTSFGASPNATTSAAWMPRSAHTDASALALLTPAAATSRKGPPEWEASNSLRPSLSSELRMSSGASAGCRMINFVAGTAQRSSASPRTARRNASSPWSTIRASAWYRDSHAKSVPRTKAKQTSGSAGRSAETSTPSTSALNGVCRTMLKRVRSQVTAPLQQMARPERPAAVAYSRTLAGWPALTGTR